MKRILAGGGERFHFIAGAGKRGDHVGLNFVFLEVMLAPTSETK
jgi:hypothetical protein